jgi:glutathione peroxidase-family protein
MFSLFIMKTVKSFLLSLAILLFALTSNAQSEIPGITDPRLDFKVLGINGDSLKLSSMKGKVFLLDFWASWCGPCRISNRQLVKIYDKYKKAGFEILGISLDEDIKDWKKAIAKDKISWLQCVDTKGWDAKSAYKWNVEAIPASFLIDKKGNVVAVNLEKDELEKKIKELLGV